MVYNTLWCSFDQVCVDKWVDKAGIALERGDLLIHKSLFYTVYDWNIGVMISNRIIDAD